MIPSTFYFVNETRAIASTCRQGEEEEEDGISIPHCARAIAADGTTAHANPEERCPINFLGERTHTGLADNELTWDRGSRLSSSSLSRDSLSLSLAIELDERSMTYLRSSDEAVSRREEK